MREVERVLAQANRLVSEARNLTSYGERAGAYALAIAFASDLHRIAVDDFADDAYLREKASQFEWHIGAALGFDETNGHPDDQHRVWSLGALSSYEGRLENLSE